MLGLMRGAARALSAAAYCCSRSSAVCCCTVRRVLATASASAAGSAGTISSSWATAKPAGVGTIGVIDGDRVELSNLQRQVAHTTDRIGVAKALSAAQSAAALNPEIRVEPYPTRLTAANALDLVGRYDLVLDGSDNFATRFLVADACVLARRTLVSAAVLRFDGSAPVALDQARFGAGVDLGTHGTDVILGFRRFALTAGDASPAGRFPRGLRITDVAVRTGR